MPARDLLPMPYRSKRGRLSQEERAEYQRRHERYQSKHPEYLAGFGRPSAETVNAVWKLLESSVSKEIARLNEGPERAALVIVLDHAMNAGERGARLTFTDVFDAVCRRFSDHHRLCPAGSVYDMTPETVRGCWKDLQNEQIHLGKLFDAVIRNWPQNPLFRCELNHAGNDTFWTVRLKGKDPNLARAFRDILRAGGYHTGKTGLRLLLRKPERSATGRRKERDICCDRLEYDVVPAGLHSEQILSLQEDVELLFHAEAFNRDYEMVTRRLNDLRKEIAARCPADPPLIGLSRQKRQFPGRKIEVWSLRDEHLFKRAIARGLNLDAGPAATVEPQLEGAEKWTAEKIDRLKAWLKRHDCGVPEEAVTRENILQAAAATSEWRMELQGLLQQYDEYHRLTREFRGVRRQVHGRRKLVAVYNEFHRVLNGRYQARHFWPSFVGPKSEEHENADTWKPFRGAWFKAPPADGTRAYEELVGVDISSSQTQIIAVFLGIEDLEKEAQKNFKSLMSQIAWARHYDAADDFKLAMLPPDGDSPRVPNYTGPNDPRLQQLCKALWMQICYGSNANTVQGEQKTHPQTYGRGWTATNAGRFVRALHQQYPDVKTYLEACKELAREAYRRSRFDGVRITDPLDGVAFQWNPVLRQLERCRHGSRDEVRIQLPPGFKTGRKQYRVDIDNLAKRVAPCIIHLLDAFYSGLVMKHLARSGIRNFVGIHDCWLVPERVKVGEDIQSGEALLIAALESAAVEWYRGLDGVYRSLCGYLDPHPKYGPWIRSIYQKWKRRVKAGYSPQFSWKKEV